MTPTAWKVIALSLAALLLVTVGALIGTNLASSGDDSAQMAPATTAQEVKMQWSHSVDPSLGIMGWKLNSVSRSTMSVATGNPPPLATLRLFHSCPDPTPSSGVDLSFRAEPGTDWRSLYESEQAFRDAAAEALGAGEQIDPGSVPVAQVEFTVGNSTVSLRGQVTVTWLSLEAVTADNAPNVWFIEVDFASPLVSLDEAGRERTLAEAWRVASGGYEAPLTATADLGGVTYTADFGLHPLTPSLEQASGICSQ